MCHHLTKKAKNSARTDLTGGCLSPFLFFSEGWASAGRSEVVPGCLKPEGENWIKEHQLHILQGFCAPLLTPFQDGKLDYPKSMSRLKALPSL